MAAYIVTRVLPVGVHHASYFEFGLKNKIKNDEMIY